MYISQASQPPRHCQHDSSVYLRVYVLHVIASQGHYLVVQYRNHPHKRFILGQTITLQRGPKGRVLNGSVKLRAVY